MILWMLWAIGTGVLLGCAGHLLELFARGSGRPGRWVWASVIVGSFGLQARSLVARSDEAVLASGASAPLVDPSIALWRRIEEALAPTPFEQIESLIVPAWAIASGLLLSVFVVGLVRLRRRAGEWPRREVAGHEILVSDGFGPALLGFLVPRIVVPRRLLETHPGALLAVVRHEAEHRSSGDAWILGAGALVAALFPWNLALWWQLARLRAAVEIDCDQRVVRAGVHAGEYARVLLTLGQPGSPSTHVPAFLHPPLERRLEMIVRGVRKRSSLVTASGLCVAALLVLGACEAPSPTLQATDARASVEGADAEVPSGIEIRGLLPGGDPQSVSPADAPLVLVDGVEVEEGFLDNELEDLTPDEIESIEVIKGPAAARIYGERGTNGVISITLKAGG